MTAQSLQTPLPTFTGLDGLPLAGGYIYFGTPNQDPEQYPKTVYWDEAMTLAATQPLRTTAGYISRNGAPATVWIDGNCSIRVRDSANRQVYYQADWAGFVGAAAEAASEAATDYAAEAEAAAAAAEAAQALAEAAAATAQLVIASVRFATRALMNADLAHAAGVFALVYADATVTNNGMYYKLGASGTGSWVAYQGDRVTELEDRADTLETDVAALQAEVFTAAETATSLLGDETEGIAIVVTTDDADAEVRVIDSVTPANDYQGDLFDFLASTCFPTAKMVTKEDGSLGWSDHNFFFDCERPDGANWTRTGMTASAPSGGYSTLTASAVLASARQNISVLERGYYHCLNYIFKAGTSPYVFLRVQTSFSDLYAYFNISLGSVGTVDAGLTATIHTTDVDGSELPAGEFRCMVVHKAGTSGAFASFLSHMGLADANGSTAVTIGRTALFRKSQSNWGITPTGYITTTAGARYGVPFDWSGETRRVLVEEVASAYHSRYGDDLTQAAYWTATNITPTLTATGPHGEPCSVLTATAGNGTILQSFTSSTATNTFQARVKRRTGSGSIYMTADGGATWTDITSQIDASAYSRVYVHRSDAAMNIGFKLATSGDAIDVAMAVSGNRGIILSPRPTYDPGAGGFYQRASDSFRIATTKFNLGTEFTFFVDYEISGDSAASGEKAGVIGASDLHSISRVDEYYVARGSVVGGTTANNFLCDSPNSSLRVEGAMRIKANDFAAQANGTSEVYDNRVGVGSLSSIFAGSDTGQIFLRRLLLVPRGLADDSLPAWRWSRTGADSRYLADIKVAKYGEVTDTAINREPNVELLGDNDQYSLLSVSHMQRYITPNPSTGEAPGHLVQKVFRFDKATEELSLERGPVVIAEQASWTSGLGHLQGIVLCKVKYGAKKGRLIAVYAGLDTADGLIVPDHRRLYTKYSDDNGATWSAATMIYDPGAGRYAVTTGPGQAIQFTSGAYAGRIVVPMGTDASAVTDRVGVVYSDDAGATWTTVSTVNSGFEPTVHLLPDGTTAVMTIRVESSPWRLYASSTDGCVTWSATALMTDLGIEGTNVGMSMLQNEPEGDSGLYGEQLLVGVRQNFAPYPLRSKLTIEEVEGATLTVSGTQFTPLGTYRPCGYASVQRLLGGYLAIGYESSPTGVSNNYCDIRLMVVRWP